MTRDEKITEARRLRGQGLSYRAIGEQLGCHGSCVARWLHPERCRVYRAKDEARPERKAAKRAWEREHDRRPCARCGRPRGVGAHRDKRDGMCATCYAEVEAARLDARAEQIVGWWAQGLRIVEIAGRLGWTANHAGVEIARLRKRGYDLPHRRPRRSAGRVAAR